MNAGSSFAVGADWNPIIELEGVVASGNDIQDPDNYEGFQELFEYNY